MPKIGYSQLLQKNHKRIGITYIQREKQSSRQCQRIAQKIGAYSFDFVFGCLFLFLFGSYTQLSSGVTSDSALWIIPGRLGDQMRYQRSNPGHPGTRQEPYPLQLLQPLGCILFWVLSHTWLLSELAFGMMLRDQCWNCQWSGDWTQLSHIQAPYPLYHHSSPWVLKSEFCTTLSPEKSSGSINLCSEGLQVIA